jgi:hypothetical protein
MRGGCWAISDLWILQRLSDPFAIAMQYFVWKGEKVKIASDKIGL